MRFIASLKRFRERGRARLEWIVAWTLAVLVSSMLVYAITRHPPYPILTEHHVLIEKKVAPRKWWIVSDEHPQGFMYYACDDFKNEKWIYAGYYAKLARYMAEDGCDSIREQGLEFDYDWKPDGTAKTIEEAGYGNR